MKQIFVDSFGGRTAWSSDKSIPGPEKNRGIIGPGSVGGHQVGRRPLARPSLSRPDRCRGFGERRDAWRRRIPPHEAALSSTRADEEGRVRIPAGLLEIDHGGNSFWPVDKIEPRPRVDRQVREIDRYKCPSESGSFLCSRLKSMIASSIRCIRQRDLIDVRPGFPVADRNALRWVQCRPPVCFGRDVPSPGGNPLRRHRHEALRL